MYRINGAMSQPGDIKVLDLNGDGVISGAEIGSSDNLVPYENNEEMQAQEDEIFFNWTTGRSPEPYNDLNQNVMYDLFETFFDAKWKTLLIIYL